MPNKAFVSLSLLLALGLQAKTNVVVFLTDDQGWGDLSLNGNTNLSTPNIDSIGEEGAVFDRFYVCPVCSPTRAEFLTGRHHVRSGVYSTSAGGERMDLDETTIADLFSKAGMPPEHSVNGIMVCSFPIILLVAGLIISMAFVQAIGGTTTMLLWKEMANW